MVVDMSNMYFSFLDWRYPETKTAFVRDVTLNRSNFVVATFDRDIINTESDSCVPIPPVSSGYPDNHNYNKLTFDMSTQNGHAVQSLLSIAQATGREVRVSGGKVCETVSGTLYQKLRRIILK